MHLVGLKRQDRHQLEERLLRTEALPRCHRHRSG